MRPFEVHVTLTPSDEVLRLREDVALLQGELKELRERFNRLELLFREESIINQELVDLLRSHNIPYRRAIDAWRKDHIAG